MNLFKKNLNVIIIILENWVNILPVHYKHKDLLKERLWKIYIYIYVF